jgi:dihydroorotase-like cyclic amidohydrolase
VNARNLRVLPGAIDSHTHMEAAAFGLHSRDTFESGTRAAVDVVRSTKARGLQVTAETCPHYLLLDERAYATADGRQFSVIPPSADSRGSVRPVGGSQRAPFTWAPTSRLSKDAASTAP